MQEKVKTLGIFLSNEQKSGYCAGEAVSGYVLVEVSTVTNIKGIKLEVSGLAQVCWNDGPQRESLRSSARPPLSQHVKEEIECLSISKTIFEPTDSEGWISLSAGRHEIPFQFELPTRPLVSSFSGKYGSVKYWMTAVLQRPPYHNQIVSRDFPVIAHVDVNSPLLLCPVSINGEKMIGTWIFTSGPISLRVNIERKGYCNGESIPIYAEIENCSSRLIVPKAVICQTQTYLAGGKTRSCRQVVASVRGNHVPSGSSDVWNGKQLKIPPISPSVLNSSIIRVDYSLAVIIQIPGARKLKVELPVVIGTIPFNGLGSRSSSMSSQFSMDMSWLTLALPDLPEAPPNYADVVTEAEFDLHRPSSHQSEELERQLEGPAFAYVQEFRFQPPPFYSEVDPHPPQGEV
ncbi:arrestin domain-containing protein 4 [Clupea harengus]|uniref:Arrestin domain-containing protein 4 n=1 Tax=Clupea harengus TaxID=7950 RepID=A0A6P3W4I1_CLUHA|nr:arrestin domain-containing protein 4 [Clupea harengus]XP_031420291.1 arrestin domain-containing protein 4 [Clupea harengus]